jgi:hypothetical protein
MSTEGFGHIYICTLAGMRDTPNMTSSLTIQYNIVQRHSDSHSGFIKFQVSNSAELRKALEPMTLFCPLAPPSRLDLVLL